MNVIRLFLDYHVYPLPFQITFYYMLHAKKRNKEVPKEEAH